MLHGDLQSWSTLFGHPLQFYTFFQCLQLVYHRLINANGILKARILCVFLNSWAPPAPKSSVVPRSPRGVGPAGLPRPRGAGRDGCHGPGPRLPPGPRVAPPAPRRLPPQARAVAPPRWMGGGLGAIPTRPPPLKGSRAIPPHTYTNLAIILWSFPDPTHLRGSEPALYHLLAAGASPSSARPACRCSQCKGGDHHPPWW